ncbi:non-ribosomal peptide synthetase [Amycolatopsis saalfeldensis]|uniref:Amino acid adenylation domain-containing protein n=1 Tax=Amycolatopsis saalfeldensis TaxID=394193 RepID=A0A1H8SHT4_9PSEU|nr:non-ribosomal peptide synthetase [Amycolatopsis saalfeldensis]SEO77733.1 amino acid adenylation domain-containing protein [Amycolatopsis saalfeldensis]
MSGDRTGPGSTDQPFTRLVAPFERWYLAFPASMAPVMTFCVEGFGHVDAGQLREAVAVGSEACPGARLRLHGRNWVDSGETPPVRVVAGPGPDSSALHEIPELRSALPDAAGANCEVLLFDGPSPTIVFRVLHIVMDARGMLLWIADVFRALRGEATTGARSTVTILDLEDPLYRKADVSKEEYATPSLLGLPGNSDRAGTMWRRRTIDGTFPALAAKIATRLAAGSGRPKAAISFPVDLRPFHPQVQSDRSTSNLSLTVALDIPAGQDWEATYEQVLTMLSERSGEVHAPGPEILGTPLWALKRVIKGIDRRARRRDRFSLLVNVNNLGRLDPLAFSTGEFEATGMYLLESQEPASPLSLAVTEVDGRTELTLAWWAGAEQEKRADALLDDLCELLSPAENRRHSEIRPPAPPEDGTAGRGVVEQFRAQVEAAPDAVAISGPEGDISYAELARRARVVAAALRDRGIGRDTVVGLLADRTVAAVAGAWGVLLAGAAYLPMDTKHPDGRVRSLLEDAKSPVCLVGKPHDGRDNLPGGCARIVLDDLPFSAEPPEIDGTPSPGDLAYVVYTSGSTGKPKGVEIEHRSLSNYASWAVREHGIDASTRLPLLCSLSFDVAEISLILPFLVGGTLLLMKDELSHVAIQEVLDNGATMLSLTPSHLDLITRLDLEPRDVRALIVIGEQFTRSVALRARELFGPDCRIINLYGPAEATIGVSHHFFDAERDTGAAVPIGEPLDGVTFHLLSPDRQFVAPGEPGELYIGGVQLARGYRGRPDLTRQRFVRLADGSRVYRTGDIARRLESGAVEFCGRIDDQLKLHGHRIEPAEIAQTLETHDAVASAVVVARAKPGSKDKALCGYFLTVADVGIPELVAYLEQRLPHYMIPAVLLEVDEIPRSVNGKVSVGSLPDPFAAAGTPAAAGTGPLDDVESEVAKVWSQVLGVETGAIESASDFHRLGGDSVSLITMVAMVARQVVGPAGERAFTGRMPEIIRDATVRQVAELAKQAKAA